MIPIKDWIDRFMATYHEVKADWLAVPPEVRAHLVHLAHSSKATLLMIASSLMSGMTLKQTIYGIVAGLITDQTALRSSVPRDPRKYAERVDDEKPPETPSGDTISTAEATEGGERP